jgi:mono/diheme cytochrome c family protein
VLDRQSAGESISHETPGETEVQPDDAPSRRRRRVVLGASAAAFVALISLVAHYVAPRGRTPDDKTRADRKAKEAFRHLNFFAEGDGMHMSPGLVWFVPRKLPLVPGSLDQRLWGRLYRHRWGVNYENGSPVGLSRETYKGMAVGALGCVACHSGRAAGRFIVGLGNKNIDSYQVGTDLLAIEKAWSRLVPDFVMTPERTRVEASALEFAHLLADPRRGNLTQGLVPVSVIRDWFYRQQADGLRPPEMPRGAVKVPSLWGYGLKRSVGQFCDGFGEGQKPGWAIAVELVAGQKPENVRAYQEKVENAETLFADFLPPRYPYRIDRTRAAAGKTVFDATCSGCHGTYDPPDANGHPIFKAPNYISWSNPKVQTDRDRLDGNTAAFRKLVESNPLSELIRARPDRGEGFFAPRLVGIWSRFPYLHNGSVPSIAALLTPPERRPTLFSLREAGEEYRFDRGALGLTVPKPGSDAEARLLREAREGRRDVYYTKRCGRPPFEHTVMDDTDHRNGCGYSNQGHLAGTTLPDEAKRNLIAYLKTL